MVTLPVKGSTAPPPMPTSETACEGATGGTYRFPPKTNKSNNNNNKSLNIARILNHASLVNETAQDYIVEATTLVTEKAIIVFENLKWVCHTPLVEFFKLCKTLYLNMLITVP